MIAILFQVETPRYKMSEEDRVHNDYRPGTIDILEYRELEHDYHFQEQ